MATLHFKKVLSHEVPFLPKSAEVRFMGETYTEKQKQVMVFEVITVERIEVSVTKANIKQFEAFFKDDFYNR